jgi:hypothetical protein
VATSSAGEAVSHAIEPGKLPIEATAVLAQLGLVKPAEAQWHVGPFDGAMEALDTELVRKAEVRSEVRTETPTESQQLEIGAQVQTDKADERHVQHDPNTPFFPEPPLRQHPLSEAFPAMSEEPRARGREPNWESGKNQWWNFRRADGDPWSLAGLWNTWIDKATGEVHESYTMLTLNADHHPLMSRMHKPDPKLPPDQQDKRSVIPIAKGDIDLWLAGTVEEATRLLQLAPVEVFEAGPGSAGSEGASLTNQYG